MRMRNRMHYIRILRFYGRGYETGVPWSLQQRLRAEQLRPAERLVRCLMKVVSQKCSYEYLRC